MLSRGSLHRILSSWGFTEAVLLAFIIMLTSISSTVSIVPNILLVTFTLTRYILKLDLSPIGYLASIVSTALLDAGSVILIYILGYLSRILLKYGYMKTPQDMRRYKAINILRTAAIISAFYPISMYSKIFSSNIPGYDPFFLGSLTLFLQILFIYMILREGNLVDIIDAIINIYKKIISLAPHIARIMGIFVAIIGATMYKDPALILIYVTGIIAEKITLRIDKNTRNIHYKYLIHCITPVSLLLYMAYLGF